MSERSVLLVGGGGREHALAFRLRPVLGRRRLLCAPGNPGMAALGCSCLPVAVDDVPRLCEIVRREDVDLVVVGPEAALWAGARDAILAERGERTAVFGPSKRAAEIEASKVFAKGFMARHGIPTASYCVASSLDEVERFLHAQDAASRWVVKADGLQAGKGVTLCDDHAHAREVAGALLQGGGSVVLEERLSGSEASLMALCEGERVVLLPPCEDHKTLGEGDQGPMTGGMGALCPTGVVDDALLGEARERILLPAAAGLCREGRPFSGLLYAGLMCTRDGPKVLEFNSRFGDPETQALMMALDEDLLPWLEAVARGRLADSAIAQISASAAAVCVVLCAAGYPGTPRTGDRIFGLEDAASALSGSGMVFHAGTRQEEGGPHMLTSGGRVLGVTARAASVEQAREAAYAAVSHIRFDGMTYRRDIGARVARRRPRVLCVDDEPQVLRSLERTFAGQPFEMMQCGSPLRALDLLAQADLFAVVSDYRMPEQDGVRFLTEARRRRPGLLLILLSGCADEAAVRRAKEEGIIDEFLHKPWSAERLLSLLRSARPTEE